MDAKTIISDANSPLQFICSAIIPEDTDGGVANTVKITVSSAPRNPKNTLIGIAIAGITINFSYLSNSTRNLKE